MSVRTISLPAEAVGLHIIASVSGGKDSTALILALREAGIGYLRAKLGIVIDVVAVNDDPHRGYSAMVERIRHRAGFPGRMQRWCTRELKIEPLRRYHDRLIEMTGIETVSAMGIRAAESDDRAKMPEWEDEPEGQRSWGGYVWGIITFIDPKKTKHKRDPGRCFRKAGFHVSGKAPSEGTMRPVCICDGMPPRTEGGLVALHMAASRLPAACSPLGAQASLGL